MNEIKSKIFNTIARLGLAASLSMASQPAFADDTINTAKKAITLLYPPTLAMDKALKSENIDAQNAAGAKMIDAQRQITALFGKGADGFFSYNYNGREINVPIDGDLSYIGIRPFTANKDIIRENGNVIEEGKKYLQFFMQPTLAMTSQFHLALNGINPDPNRDVEKDLMTASRTSIYPIGQKSTKPAATHIFTIPEQIFSGHPDDHALLDSFHKIPYVEVTKGMFKECCEDRLNELNNDAMDLFAKPPQP
ncbi:MAG: hypothetical protein COB14_00865 [Alphaproteobacteria bacterium]|nr:MAG: hypothetical protein COB14_00865 [Alphaproteobacteria bacterium]